MNRYKITRESYPNVRKYLKGVVFKKDAPTYARKFKEDLSFKKKELYYKGKRVIPQEDVDSYLRKEYYSKASTVPLTRDGLGMFFKKETLWV